MPFRDCQSLGPQVRWVWSVAMQGTQLASNVGSELCTRSWSAEQWRELSAYATRHKCVDSWWETVWSDLVI